MWGPSEVNAWIESAYPSKRRRTGGVRKGPETITRLRLVVEASGSKNVRTATAEALKLAGLEAAKPRTGPQPPRVVGSFRRLLATARVHVSLRFDPPIHVSSCKRIVEELNHRFHVVAVSAHKARPPLRPRSD